MAGVRRNIIPSIHQDALHHTDTSAHHSCPSIARGIWSQAAQGSIGAASQHHTLSRGYSRAAGGSRGARH
jgi:hypothetical protein